MFRIKNRILAFNAITSLFPEYLDKMAKIMRDLMIKLIIVFPYYNFVFSQLQRVSSIDQEVN